MRQEQILLSVIENYTRLKEPVSSVAVAQTLPFKVSTATIRNEMVKLEVAGLLTKAHISSGRIPTEFGYRYFVNYILPKQAGYIDLGLSDEHQHRIDEIFEASYLQLPDLMAQATETLAELTNFVAITMGPKLSQHKLIGFQLVLLNPYKLMLVLATDQGVVENQIILLPDAISHEAIDQLTQLIQDRFIGQRIQEIAPELKKTYFDHLDKNFQSLLQHDLLFEPIIQKIKEQRVQVEGEERLVRYLLEADLIDQIEGLYQFLGDISLVTDLLSTQVEGIDIRFGKELQDKRLENFTLVTSSLQALQNDDNVKLAVLGPETMPYLHVTRLFQGIRTAISQHIVDYLRQEDRKFGQK